MSEEKKPLVWEYEQTNAAEAATLKEALRAVKDPEMGFSVIELGLIRNVAKTDNRVLITMILTTPFCPYGPQMIEDVRIAAQVVTKEEVAIDLRMDPWDMDMMEEGFDPGWGFF